MAAIERLAAAFIAAYNRAASPVSQFDPTETERLLIEAEDELQYLSDTEHVLATKPFWEWTYSMQTARVAECGPLKQLLENVKDVLLRLSPEWCALFVSTHRMNCWSDSPEGCEIDIMMSVVLDAIGICQLRDVRSADVIADALLRHGDTVTNKDRTIIQFMAIVRRVKDQLGQDATDEFLNKWTGSFSKSAVDQIKIAIERNMRVPLSNVSFNLLSKLTGNSEWDDIVRECVRKLEAEKMRIIYNNQRKKQDQLFAQAKKEQLQREEQIIRDAAVLKAKVDIRTAALQGSWTYMSIGVCGIIVGIVANLHLPTAVAIGMAYLLLTAIEFWWRLNKAAHKHE